MQPNRHPRKAVDLPLLLAAECLPSSLQGHIQHESSIRATPQVHHHRIHALAWCRCSTHLPIRRGHLSRGGGSEGSPGCAGRQLEFVASVCLSRSHHLWNDGMRVSAIECHVILIFVASGPSPRAWLSRMLEVIRFPWFQGVLSQTGPGYAGIITSKPRRPTARSTTTPKLWCSTVFVTCLAS